MASADLLEDAFESVPLVTPAVFFAARRRLRGDAFWPFNPIVIYESITTDANESECPESGPTPTPAKV